MFRSGQEAEVTIGPEFNASTMMALLRIAVCLFVIVLLTMHSTVAWAGARGVACFSPDGAIIAWPKPDCTVAIWDVALNKKVATLYDSRDVGRERVPQTLICDIVASSFSPDGKLLATQRTGEPIILWTVPDLRKLATLVEGSRAWIDTGISVEFSRDSRLIVALGVKFGGKQSGKNRMTVWEVATHEKLLHASLPYGTEFQRVTLSPDRKTLMAYIGSSLRGFGTQKIQLWDIERADELVTLTGHSASFSPDGRFVLVTGWDSEHMLWDIRAGKRRVLGQRDGGVQPQSK